MVGVTAYSTFVYTLAGGPLAWLKAQAAWGNTYTVTGFWLAKWEHAASAGWQFVLEPFGLWSLLAVCLVAATVAPVARLLGLGYATYLVVYLLPPLMINLPAIGRMTCVLFPTFIWLGSWAHTRPRFVVALVVFPSRSTVMRGAVLHVGENHVRRLSVVEPCTAKLTARLRVPCPR